MYKEQLADANLGQKGSALLQPNTAVGLVRQIQQFLVR